MNLKDIKYNNSLKKILGLHHKRENPKLNKGKNILILFEGTDPINLNEVKEFSEYLHKYHRASKLLCYFDNKGELANFEMAVYNNSSISWYGMPKPHIFKLMESIKFDLLINLNPLDKKHIHALACSANADFKLSLPTSLPHNFQLIFSPKKTNSLRDIIDEILVYYDILSEKKANNNKFKSQANLFVEIVFLSLVFFLV